MEDVKFRGEKFLVQVCYYVCEDTGEQFTTTEQDTLTILTVPASENKW